MSIDELEQEIKEVKLLLSSGRASMPQLIELTILLLELQDSLIYKLKGIAYGQNEKSAA
jgi:hypothetical protein